MAWQGKKITIVGLGLMGGSLALALRPLGVRLAAVEPDAGTRARALATGIVDEVTAVLAEGVAAADIVVLAAPVRTILALIPALAAARPDGCDVIDLGSTKAAVLQALDELPPVFRAVGGHPMCGKERWGLDAAEGTLFQDQTFVLCRGRHTDAGAVAMAEALVAAVGAHPLWLPPDVHDEIVALVSHLPYFVAACLMAEAARTASTSRYVWTVSAGGFRDTTRLSGSSPQMLHDIVVTNRPAILAALQGYRARLDEVIALLEVEDDAALARWLAARQLDHQEYRKWSER